MLLSLKKLLNEKIFKTSFPMKKAIIHFPRQTPLPLFKRYLAPKTVFCPFLRNTSAMRSRKRFTYVGKCNFAVERKIDRTSKKSNFRF